MTTQPDPRKGPVDRTPPIGRLTVTLAGRRSEMAFDLRLLRSAGDRGYPALTGTLRQSCGPSSWIAQPVVVLGSPISGRRSDDDEVDARVKEPEVAGVRGDDLLPRAAGADDNVCVDNVGGRARGEQPPDVCGVDPVEGYDVGRRLSDKARQADLAFWLADCLRESGGGDSDACADFASAGQQRYNPPVVPVEGDEPSRVHGDAGDHAAGLL